MNNHISVLPRIFLRRLAIASYYTNSKPSQSNSYTMLLPLSISKPNVQVNQKSTVKFNTFICLKLRQSKIRSRTFKGKSDLHLRSAPLLQCLAVLEPGVPSAGTFRLVARNESTRSQLCVSRLCLKTAALRAIWFIQPKKRKE